jgi:hypothetical protein
VINTEKGIYHMASGFQNNNDQLTPTYYRVSIDTSGYSTTAADNDSGGVEVWDHNFFTTLNTTEENSIRRARGNLRWLAILDELQRFSNAEILDVTVLKTGSVAQTAADDTSISVAFTIGYAQEEYVLGGWQQIISSGTFSDGVTSLTTSTYETLSAANRATAIANCIKESIVRGITRGGTAGYSRRYRAVRVLTGILEQVDPVVTITQPDTPVNVWSDVSSSIIDTMTQINY